MAKALPEPAASISAAPAASNAATPGAEDGAAAGPLSATARGKKRAREYTHAPQSNAPRRIEAVVYAGYEIQAQYPSPYPFDELLGASGVDKAAVTGAASRDPHGRFGKRTAGTSKKDRPSHKGAASSPAPSDTPPIKQEESSTFADSGPSANGEQAVKAETPSAQSLLLATCDLAERASPRTADPARSAASDDVATALVHPPESPPVAPLQSTVSSSSCPALIQDDTRNIAAPPSPTLSAPAPASANGAVPNGAFPNDPHPPPIPSTSDYHAPSMNKLPGSHSSNTPLPTAALPATQPADPLPTTPAAPAAMSTNNTFSLPMVTPTDATSLTRGRGGRFLPKPPGESVKAKRVAERAAKAAAATASDLSEQPRTLTQRQQREMARQAREERERETAKETQKETATQRLLVCDRCFKYMMLPAAYKAHQVRRAPIAELETDPTDSILSLPQKECHLSQPPGRRVYQRGATSIWEVDGANSKLYCQNLCLFAKLFIEHKYMFFDSAFTKVHPLQVEGFTFYLLTETMSKQEWVLGYFSKVHPSPLPDLFTEKISYDDYNLACIVVFPPFRQKGWATLLIEFSYELSRRLSSTPGTPERPLSDLGQKGYLAHWTAVLVRYFRAIFCLRSEPPLIDSVIAASRESLAPPGGGGGGGGGGKDEDDSPRKTRLRRSKGWDGELPAGTVTLAATEAKAFTLRRRAGKTRGSVDGEGEFSMPTSLEDLAEAVNLRPEDVAFAMVESGLAQWRRGGDVGVKLEDDESTEEGREEQLEELVITPELIETVALRRGVKPMPMLDIAYVCNL
ncbi:SPOSA6832_04360, partial [Sporobolomyces salmonicolor]